jgi:hypothetical protein
LTSLEELRRAYRQRLSVVQAHAGSRPYIQIPPANSLIRRFISLIDKVGNLSKTANEFSGL